MSPLPPLKSSFKQANDRMHKGQPSYDLVQLHRDELNSPLKEVKKTIEVV